MLLLALACSLNHGVRPIGKGNVALTASGGGPIVEIYGKPIPLPVSVVGVRYGLTDRNDVHAAFHSSMPLFFSNVWGVDFGASHMIFPQDGARPALVTDNTVMLGWGDAVEGQTAGGFRAWGETALLASWTLGQHNLVYVGGDLFLQPRPGEVWGAPLVGWRVQGQKGWFGLESKWINPWDPTERLTAHYYGPAQHGALSLQLGFGITFKKEAP